jgi:hypothetical protein
METLPTIINFILALISVLAWLLNVRESKSRVKESKARTDNFDATTDKIRNDILSQLEEQFEQMRTRLVSENGELQKRIKFLEESQREKDRVYDLERTAKRDELNNIKQQLVTVQDLNAALIIKFEQMQAVNKEKDVRIQGLERQNVELRLTIEQHTLLLKKTGQLTPNDKAKT